MKKLFTIAGASILALAALTMVAIDRNRPIAVLDVEPGEYLFDMLARSSYNLERLPVWPSGMTQILLTPFETERRRTPVIRLRMGNDVVTLPYVPARGDIVSTAGKMRELDLRFFNFSDLAPEGKRNMSRGFDDDFTGTPEEDIDSIVILFNSLRPFNWSGDQAAYCSREVLVPIRHGWCMSARNFDEAWPSSDEVRAALISYQRELDAAWATDDWDQIDAVDYRLVLGQWISSNGTRVSLDARVRFDVANADQKPEPLPSQIKRGLVAFLNFEAYPHGMEGRIDSCFAGGVPALADRKPLTPEGAKKRYSYALNILLEEVKDVLQKDEAREEINLKDIDLGYARERSVIDATCKRLSENAETVMSY